MKQILLGVMVALLPSLCQAQTPDQVYYQMLHNDSICMQNFEHIHQYGKLRSAARGLELVGGILLGVVVVGVAASGPDTEAETPVVNALLFSGSGLILAGWITEGVAISKLKKVEYLPTPRDASTQTLIRSRK